MSAVKMAVSSMVTGVKTVGAVANSAPLAYGVICKQQQQQQQQQRFEDNSGPTSTCSRCETDVCWTGCHDLRQEAHLRQQLQLLHQQS
jgi:hypothetical protein